MKPTHKLRFLFIASLLLAPSITLHAQITYTWDGGGGNDQWQTENNWVGNPATPVFDDQTTLIFNFVGAARLTNRLHDGRTIGHLVFNENADNDVAILFRRSTGVARNLTMGGANTTAPTITVDAEATGSFRMGSSDTSGNMILASNLTITHNGSGTLEIEQPITQSGTRSLTKEGSGTLIFSDVNTYQGATNINGGTLQIDATGSTHANSAVTVSNSGTALIVNGTVNGTVTVSANATLGGTGMIGGDTSITDDGKLEFDLTSAPGTHDSLELAAGKTLTFGADATLTLNPSGAATTGTYTLVSAPGGVGTLPAFTVNLPTGWAADPPTVSGTDLVITITVAPTVAFTSWIAGTFANGGIPEGQRGENDDFDNDGISNLVEFAIAGEDPTVPNASVGSFDGTTLGFTKRGEATGLTHAIQESTDLGNADDWTEVTGGTYTNDATTISYAFPGGGPARNFLRLQIMSN